MKADRNIVYDGQYYKEGEEIWDFVIRRILVVTYAKTTD